MRKMNADEFGKDYEYEQAKRKQRKEQRDSRNQRKGRKGIWEAKGSDE